MLLRRACLLLFVIASLAVAAGPRVRLGGVTIGAGYSHYSGYPYFYGPYSFDPFFFSPHIHPGFYSGFPYQPSLGNVKVQTGDKAAWVYIDGALAGQAGKLRDMWLHPGAYDLEVRGGGHNLTQRIYVLSGKTLRVTPGMMREVRQ